MQEVTHPLLNSTLLSVVLLLTAAVTYSFHLKLQLRKRISVLRSRTPEEIPADKIIIAIEPNQLFFKLADTPHAGYREVILKQESEGGLLTPLTRLFRKKTYYKLTHQKTEIATFVQSLAQNHKIQLYLYTGAPLEVTEFVLKQLALSKHFPEQFRVGYSQHNKMHAVEVDPQTNRVIICTASKKGVEDQYSKYFLTIGKREHNLTRMARKLNKLVNLNDDIDELHNELNFLKIKVESESEGGQPY